MAQAPAVDAASQHHSAQLPKAIAALKPFDISVRKDGVYITMRVLFDDGCGYFVPRDKAHFVAPRESYTSYTALGEGMWWFHST